MERNKFLSNLADASIQIGQEIAYVQGGGGNTSVKLNNSKMAIKASGIKLKDMTQDQGFSIVDYSLLNKYLDSPDSDDDRFSKRIASFVVETENRPSIETGFHSLLGKYVIHTHSAFVNVLTCSSEGHEEVLKMFPNSVWVEYATPGRDLTIELKKNIPFPLPEEGHIFLQNHGLIVWALSHERVIKIHNDISQTIKESLGLTSFLFDKNAFYSPNTNQSEILFPDQAVYTIDEEQMLKSDGAQETIYTYNYILNNINAIGFSPSFLPKDEVNKILDMESEKYRQSIIK